MITWEGKFKKDHNSVFLTHGSYRQGYKKFKDFSRTSKSLYYSFQDYKFMKHTESDIKILLRKRWTDWPDK